MTQYLLTPATSQGEGPGGPAAPAPSATDLVPGFLDLPCLGTSDLLFERQLKTAALFYEHLIVPDGWLHCAGPISEYLRARIQRRVNRTIQVRDHTVIPLLTAGIMVPALRGRHPASPGEPPIGFNLLDVFTGSVRDRNGVVDLGVHCGDCESRHMVLDPTEDNLCIVQALSSATSTFVDWTSPEVPVTAIGHDDVGDRDRWDATFRNEVLSILFEAECAFDSAKEIDDLRQTGILDEVTSATRRRWTDILASVASLRTGARTRRADFENVLSRAFGLERVPSYTALRRAADRADDRTLAAPAGMREPYWCSPSMQLGLALIDRVSTVQQLMFARRFGSRLWLPHNVSHDVLNAGAYDRLGLSSPQDHFEPEAVVMWGSPINIEGLSIQDIVDLRRRHPGFFEARRQARPDPQFWSANPELRVELQSYVEDIAATAPLDAHVTREVQFGLGVTLSTVAGGVAGYALGSLAGILIGSGTAVLNVAVSIAAESAEAAVDALVGSRLGATVDGVIRRRQFERRVDVTLRAFGIQDPSPPAG